VLYGSFRGKRCMLSSRGVVGLEPGFEEGRGDGRTAHEGRLGAPDGKRRETSGSQLQAASSRVDGWRASRAQAHSQRPPPPPSLSAWPSFRISFIPPTPPSPP
jgi:hypothetical protein